MYGRRMRQQPIEALLNGAKSGHGIRPISEDCGPAHALRAHDHGFEVIRANGDGTDSGEGGVVAARGDVEHTPARLQVGRFAEVLGPAAILRAWIFPATMPLLVQGG
jgi:hypothetical protein